MPASAVDEPRDTILNTLRIHRRSSVPNPSVPASKVPPKASITAAAVVGAILAVILFGVIVGHIVRRARASKDDWEPRLRGHKYSRSVDQTGGANAVVRSGNGAIVGSPPPAPPPKTGPGVGPRMGAMGMPFHFGPRDRPRPSSYAAPSSFPQNFGPTGGNAPRPGIPLAPRMISSPAPIHPGGIPRPRANSNGFNGGGPGGGMWRQGPASPGPMSPGPYSPAGPPSGYGPAPGNGPYPPIPMDLMSNNGQPGQYRYPRQYGPSGPPPPGPPGSPPPRHYTRR